MATEVAGQAGGSRAAPADPRKPDLAGVFDVGGYSLYLECRGTDGPVVLFEAGSGSDSTSWNRSVKDFIGLVDNSFRRCLYDRANLGKSERVAGPRTSVTAARDLHALLAAAGLAPPYVLVGRSFGGYNVRLFAATYPSEVQGLVLVETLTPEFQDGMLALLTPEQRAGEVESFGAIEPPMDELAGGPLVEAAGLPDIPLLVVAGTKWHSGNEPWPADWPDPRSMRYGTSLKRTWPRQSRAAGSSSSRVATTAFISRNRNDSPERSMISSPPSDRSQEARSGSRVPGLLRRTARPVASTQAHVHHGQRI